MQVDDALLEITSMNEIRINSTQLCYTKHNKKRPIRTELDLRKSKCKNTPKLHYFASIPKIGFTSHRVILLDLE